MLHVSAKNFSAIWTRLWALGAFREKWLCSSFVQISEEFTSRFCWGESADQETGLEEVTVEDVQIPNEGRKDGGGVGYPLSKVSTLAGIFPFT